MGKIKFIIVAIVTLIVFGASLNAAPHAYEDDYPIKKKESLITKSIKSGVMPRYSRSVTVGNALEYWAKQQNCDDSYWEEYKSERGEQVVSFSCIFSRWAYDFKALEDTSNYKYYKKEIERYPKDMDKLKKWEEYYTAVTEEFIEFEYRFEFLISLDGKSFDEGFTGAVWHFIDDKTYEKGNNYLLKIAYRGNKEEANPISVLEGDFGEVIFQNRK